MIGPKIKRDKKTLEWALAVEVRFRMEWQQRAEKAEAQNIAYRKALQKILEATRDPWGWKIGFISDICNEALGNGKP